MVQYLDRNGPTENAIFDQKPPKVTLQAMLTGGFLQPGEYLHTGSGGGKSQLLENGKIKLPDGKIVDIHAGAAIVKQSRADRLNGFNIWHARRGEMLVGIDAIREKARGNKRGEM